MQKYTLIIAEKPGAARKIAKALADPGTLRRMVSDFGIPYYIFRRKGKLHIIVSAVGHLFNLDSKQRKWFYPIFEYEWKPSFLVRKDANYTKKYYLTLKQLVKNADEFIVATDYDTEGELIGYNILKFIAGVDNAKRMKFSTLTRDEIIQAYETASKTMNFGQLEAGMTRHELDWLWGINLTRALTLSLRRNGNNKFSIISTGRVQGPTLKIILEREKEIRNFKPKPYWQIKAKVEIKGFLFEAIHEKEKIWEKNIADKIIKQIKGKYGTITAIAVNQYRQLPPPPFNTTDLQSEAYGCFKFSPKETLQIAESLYQAGYISYPRSSSQKLPPSINYRKIIHTLSSFTPYRNFVKKLLQMPQLKPKEGKKDDPAHPAIYPTHEIPDPSQLTEKQLKIYDLIVRRFLACFGPPMERESRKLTIDISGQKFFVSGKRTLFLGWGEIYKPYLDLEETSLPDVKKGEKVKVISTSLLKKKTKPPERYTQGKIIREMENRGLGTKATRAGILQTLYDRGYIKGKTIKITPLGEAVVKILSKYSPKIVSEELTRKLENEMELIQLGKKSRKEVIEEAKKVLNEILYEIKKNEERIGKELENALKTK